MLCYIILYVVGGEWGFYSVYDLDVLSFEFK